MSIQYIKDSNGQTTGVYIPIREWDELKSRLGDLEQPNIPEWQQQETEKRLEQLRNGQMNTRSWEEARKDIFKKG